MPRSNGTYTPPAGSTAATGQSISSAAHNALLGDLSTAITQSIATDGTSTVTADIPMAGKKLTGLGAPVNAQDAARFGDVDGKVVYVAKAANYTAVATDNNAVLRFTAAATLSLTAAATLGAGWHIEVVADGGDVTVDSSGTETIDGASTLIIPDGSAKFIICDGTAFYTGNKTVILKNSAGAAPTAFAELQMDSSTGHLKAGFGASTLDYAAGAWETIFDQTVAGQLYINVLNFDLFKAIRFTGLVSTDGAADNLAWRYSTNGGTTFVSTSSYIVQTVIGANTSPAAGAGSVTFGPICNGGLPSGVSAGMGINAVISRLKGVHQVHAFSFFGGYTGSSTIAGAVASFISVGSLPASPINAIQILQGNGVAFSGHVLIEGIRA